MLRIFKSVKELDFSQLTEVYAQSILAEGNERYPRLSQAEGYVQARQDFYVYLKLFFQDKSAFYAVWECGDCYVSALRVEPYKDGVLIAGLETAPQFRGCGYAQKLLSSVIQYLRERTKQPIYSHIDKHNAASLAVHLGCGFHRIKECAVYLDGSVLQSACTMLYQL